MSPLLRQLAISATYADYLITRAACTRARLPLCPLLGAVPVAEAADFLGATVTRPSGGGGRHVMSRHGPVSQPGRTDRPDRRYRGRVLSWDRIWCTTEISLLRKHGNRACSRGLAAFCFPPVFPVRLNSGSWGGVVSFGVKHSRADVRH